MAAGGSAADEVFASGTGSGRHSVLGLQQREQVQCRELRVNYMSFCGIRMRMDAYSAANRLRSTVGYSIAPTPAAAVPFSGKKPCRPIIAVR